MKSKDSLPGKATAAGRVPKQSLRICDKEKKNETKGRVISATTTKLVNRIWGEKNVSHEHKYKRMTRNKKGKRKNKCSFFLKFLVKAITHLRITLQSFMKIRESGWLR